jgi:hypothetical protein
MGFRASLAAKDIHISSETDSRVHSSSSTISHHLRFNHLNCHESKEDVLGTDNAQTSDLESSDRKDALLRESLSNEAVSIDRTSREGISSIGSEMENVTNTASTNEIGGSIPASDFHHSFITSERIVPDLGERALQGISSTTVMLSEISDSSQSSLTSMFPNTSTASSVTEESTTDSVPTRADITIFSAPHGQGGGSILHDDMMSIFSNDGLRRYGDSSTSETRGHRRVLWDALSRRGSRGDPDSDTDDLGFYSTWLDLGDDLFGELEESRYSRRRRHGPIRVSQYSRSRVIVMLTVSSVFSVTFFSIHLRFSSHMFLTWYYSSLQIREHRRAVFDSGNEQSIASCPLGIHQIGRCTCDSFLIAEESSARASISRIVMLTEALFEVCLFLNDHLGIISILVSN